MALEPCPTCARPISEEARFCVHCRTAIVRPGADIQLENFNWAHVRQAASSTVRAIKRRGPSTRLSLLFLIIASLVLSMDGMSLSLGGFSFYSDVIRNFGYTILGFAILTFPALLAFLLMLRRRPFALYGALSVFVYWFFMMGSLTRREDAHEDPFAYLLRMIIVLVSAWGAIIAFQEAAGGNVVARVLAFVSFFLLQLAPLVVVIIFSSS